MIFGSECTSHYIKNDTSLPSNSKAIPIHVHTPNGTIMSSNKVTELPLENISYKRREAHILPALKIGVPSPSTNKKI